MLLSKNVFLDWCLLITKTLLPYSEYLLTRLALQEPVLVVTSFSHFCGYNTFGQTSDGNYSMSLSQLPLLRNWGCQICSGCLTAVIDHKILVTCTLWQADVAFLLTLQWFPCKNREALVSLYGESLQVRKIKTTIHTKRGLGWNMRPCLEKEIFLQFLWRWCACVLH